MSAQDRQLDAEIIASKIKLPNPFTKKGALRPPFSDVHDVLYRTYDDSAIYVDGADLSSGVGVMKVTTDRASRRWELYLTEGKAIPTQSEGLVLVTSLHAEDHFPPHSGLPLVLPGHKQIRLAVDGLNSIVSVHSVDDEGEIRKPYSRLRGFESVSFIGPIKPRDLLTVTTEITHIEGPIYTADATLSVNGQERTIIKGLTVEERREPQGKVVLEDQIIEFAAQAAAIPILVESDKRPLFTGIGRTRFTGRDIRPDMILFALTQNAGQEGRKFSASSLVTDAKGGLVAKIEDMQAVIASEALLRRSLGV